MKVEFNIEEIPLGVIGPCRLLGIPDTFVKTWYEDAFELAIGEGRSTDFDDGDMAEHLIELFKEQ